MLYSRQPGLTNTAAGISKVKEHLAQQTNYRKELSDNGIK